MVDVIVHVFGQDARMFYDLDSLWGDARRVEWREEGSQNTKMDDGR
jgi:ribosomal silencing factor RsfS